MKIEVKDSDIHNRGVFCIEDISKDEIIEVCQIINLNDIDTKIIDNTFLYNYYFSWKDNGSAICLGNGSIYNHSIKPNSEYIKDFDNSIIRFIALKDIKVGEEILVNYNGTPDSDKKVWFEK